MSSQISSEILSRNGGRDLLGGLPPCQCPVCGSPAGALHQAREMMLGMRDVFPYWECAECGCLSLAAPPADMSAYYPGDYYSLQARSASRLRALRDFLYLSPAGFLVNWRPRTDLDAIRRARLRRNQTLLDVGCGSGTLLADLRELGYDAHGVDPFVSADVYDRFGLRVERKTLAEVTESYDVVLFRHSLEHMPIDTLALARECVKPGGICVVCIPVVAWAWQNYGTDWSQLDAPRHLFLHSRKSFEMLASKNGFRVEDVVFDSNEFQFWASESYRRDVPLSQAVRPSPAQVRTMCRSAAALNRRGQGDTAQFYLRPVVRS